MFHFFLIFNFPHFLLIFDSDFIRKSENYSKKFEGLWVEGLKAKEDFYDMLAVDRWLFYWPVSGDECRNFTADDRIACHSSVAKLH